MTEDRLDAIASDLQALCDKQAFEIARQREVIETWADIDRKSSARIEALEDALGEAYQLAGNIAGDTDWGHPAWEQLLDILSETPKP